MSVAKPEVDSCWAAYVLVALLYEAPVRFDICPILELPHANNNHMPQSHGQTANAILALVNIVRETFLICGDTRHHCACHVSTFLRPSACWWFT
ncbi:hypothetical protein L484_020417 [Morus notabilis]|uniref:Uncharacterized protein n=1 Tax=Morus notabilis TaxID=981085 RepID=W9SLR5_9ROSA|nr:hypothetical protein L484_020417 [Morus notabilis]